jgi:hypothetical protein
MKIIVILSLLAIVMNTTGCFSAAIASSNRAKAHDREAFAKTNVDREAAGLPPLTRDQFMNMASPTSETVTTVTPAETKATKRNTKTQ